MVRMFAPVINPSEPRTRHYEGGPDASDRAEMPRPAVVVLKETPEGFFLIRWTDHGVFCGDTWHMTAEEARRQAGFEFEQVGAWDEIPEDVTDPTAYAIGHAKAG